ncbi:hypothetical protein C3L33_18097, partial [Rhododendron williamsianum]
MRVNRCMGQELDEMKKRLKEMEEEAAALREMQAKVEKEMGAVQGQIPLCFRSCRCSASQASREEVDVRSIFVGNGHGHVSLFLEVLPERRQINAMESKLLSLLLMKVKMVPFVHLYLINKRLFLPRIRSALGFSSNANKKYAGVLHQDYVDNVDYACTPEEVQQHFQSCGTVNRVTILTDKFGQPKGFAYVEFVEVMAKRTNVPGMKQFRGRRFNPYMGYRFRRPYEGPQVQKANAVHALLLKEWYFKDDCPKCLMDAVPSETSTKIYLLFIE